MSHQVDPNGPGDEESPGPFVLGSVITVLFLLLAYPGIGLIREIIGQRGLALSPLVFGVLLWPLLIGMVATEPRVQAHRWWPRISGLWYGGGVALGLVVPLLLGLIWPLAVWTGLPTGLPTLICAAPLPLIVYGIRRRHRNRER